jgi:hypothetical protein
MRACHGSLLLGLLLLVAGCATNRDAASPVGSAYRGGTLVAVEEAPLEKVFAACLAGADAADLVTNEANRGQLTGHVSAMSGDFKTVTFKLRRLSTTKTELRIRVGSFGGKALTTLIYEQVREALRGTP